MQFIIGHLCMLMSLIANIKQINRNELAVLNRDFFRSFLYGICRVYGLCKTAPFNSCLLLIASWISIEWLPIGTYAYLYGWTRSDLIYTHIDKQCKQCNTHNTHQNPNCLKTASICLFLLLYFIKDE